MAGQPENEMTAPEIAELRAWIGKTEECREVVGAKLVNEYRLHVRSAST